MADSQWNSFKILLSSLSLSLSSYYAISLSSSSALSLFFSLSLHPSLSNINSNPTCFHFPILQLLSLQLQFHLAHYLLIR